MWKRLLLVTAVSATMSSMAMAANLTVGFSQVGSESAGARPKQMLLRKKRRSVASP